MDKSLKKVKTQDSPTERIVIPVAGSARDIQNTQEMVSLAQYSVDHAGDIIFWLDKQARLIYANETACRAFGYSKSELLKLKIFDLDVVFTQAKWEEVWATARQNRFLSFETIGITKKGNKFPVEVSVDYIKYDNKEYIHAYGRDASERKQAEHDLRESEKQYRMLFETMAQGVVYQDSSGRIISANPAAEKILGLPLTGLKGRSSEDTRWQAIHEDGSVYPGENHPSMIALKTGETVKDVVMGVYNPILAENRWILVNAIPQFQPGEKRPYQVYTTFTDITDRLETEKALRESEESFKNLAEQSPNMIFINQQGKIVYVNNKCLEIMGYTRDEYYSPDFNYLDLIAPESKKIVISNFKKNMKGEKVKPYDYSIVTKDGRKIEAIVNSKLIKYHGQDAILGIITDITERKKTEEALSRSEERFRSLVETSSDWVWEVDNNVIYTYASPKVKDLLGYKPEEVIGKTPFDFMPADEAGKIRDIFSEIVKTKKPSDRIENICLHKNGKRIVLETSAVPVFNAKGNFIGYRGIDRDITERKKADEEVQKLAEAMKHSSELVNLATLDGRMIFLNEAGGRMLGIDPDDVKNTNIMEVIPDHLKDIAENEIVATLSRGETWAGELQYRNLKTGELTDVQADTFTVPDPSTGEPLYLANVSRDITERKRSEKALRDSEEKYRMLFESANDAIFLMKNNKFVDCNATTLKMFKCTKKHIIGQAPVDFSPEKQADGSYSSEKAESLVKEALDGRPQFFEWNHQRLDGILFDAEVSLNRIGEAGEGNLLAIVRDITERKRAEKALQESEEKFRNITEASPMGMHLYQLETEGRLVFIGANPAADKILGVDNSQFIGKTIEEAFPPLADSEVPNRYRLAAEKGIPWQTEQISYKHNKVSGAFQVYAFQTSPGKMVATFLDITERKKAETEIKASRQRLEAHIQNTPLGVIEWDLDFKVVEWNSAAENIFGYTQEEALGRHAYDLIVPESVQDHIDSKWSDLIAGKGAIRSTNENITKNGDIRICEWYNTTLYDHEGTIVGAASLVLDITERKKAEEQLSLTQFSVDRSADCVFWIKPNGGFFYVNEATCKMLEYTREELLTMSVSDIDPFFPKEKANKFWSTLKDKGSMTFETFYKTKAGRLIPVEITSNYLKHEDIEYDYAFARDITERKKAEEALRESEATLKSIFRAAPVGIGMVSNRVLLQVNETLCDMTGYNPDELIDKNARILYPSEKEYEWVGQEKYDQIAKYGTGTVETKWKRKDGKVIDVLLSSTPIDPENLALGVTFTALDITERKRAEEELANAQSLLLAAIENTPAGILIADAPDVNIRIANSAALGIPGEDAVPLTNIPVELHPQNWQTYYPDGTSIEPEDLPLSKAILEGETSKNVEAIIRRHDGEERWILANAAPVRNANGDIVAGVVVFPDITDRKNAEKALIASEERYHNLFNSVMEGIGASDENDNIIFFNPAAAQIFSDDPNADMRGQKIIDYIPEPQRQKFFAEKEKCKSGYSSQYELEILSAKGHNKIILLSVSPRFDENSKYIGSLAALIDITETKRLQELASRAQRLESAGRIAGQVAHDFNNLLAPMVAYPEFIRETLPEGHQALKYIKDIETAAAQIAEINQQLLTLGRRGYYNLEPINLNKIINQILKYIQPIPDTLIIETDLAENLMLIKAGPSQIFRAVLNLIINSRDATMDVGHIKIKTENHYVDNLFGQFGNVPKGEYVKITISDDGSGISPEILPKILDPFFTTKSPGQKRGSGLGLSVVHAVVEDHNGYLDLKSEVGAGTTFYIYFPTTREKIKPRNQDCIKGGSEKVLIVDDDEIQRNVMMNLLKELGYQTSAVESGEKAIELIIDNPQDLLILDMIMPGGMDGCETFENVLKFYPNQKAIIVSGYAESSRVKQLIGLGAGPFLKKPLTFNVLALAVRQELDHIKENIQS